MSETKFTQGRWMMAAKPSSVVGWPVVASPQGRSICSLNYVQHSQIDPSVPGDQAFNAESRANGHLIAAAPDLYATIDPDTLEAIAAEIDSFEHSARAAGLRAMAARQRAALSRARGEPS